MWVFRPTWWCRRRRRWIRAGGRRHDPCETFDARGRVSSQGSLRQWTNGNLQALLESTPSGHRLRLRTVNGNARALMSVGLAMIGVSTAVVIGFAVSGEFAAAVASVGSLWAIGIGMFGFGALRLPAWARARRRQIEGVAARLSLGDESEVR